MSNNLQAVIEREKGATDFSPLINSGNTYKSIHYIYHG